MIKATDFLTTRQLLESIARGRTEVLDSLVDAGTVSMLLDTQSDGWTCLHAAAISPNQEMVLKVFAVEPGVAELRDNEASRAGSSRWTAVHLAIRHGHLTALKGLTETVGCSINIPWEEPLTQRNTVHIKVAICAAAFAALHGTFDMFQSVCKKSADENLFAWRDEMKRTIMTFATRNFLHAKGQMEIVEFIHEQDKKLICALDDNGESPVTWLTKLPRLEHENVRRMLELACLGEGAAAVEKAILRINKKGLSPLHYAILQGNRELTSLLLEYCSDVKDAAFIKKSLLQSNNAWRGAVAMIEGHIHGPENHASKKVRELTGDAMIAMRSQRILGDDVTLRLARETEDEISRNEELQSKDAPAALTIYLNRTKEWARIRHETSKYSELKSCDDVQATLKKKK